MIYHYIIFTSMDIVLITGANGEVGHGLIKKLKAQGLKLIAFDLNDLDKNLLPYVNTFVKGDITDKKLIEEIFKKNKINIIYHLAAILSTSGEKNPYLAHNVNVEGTINLLEASVKQNYPIKFIFPSSIAVYGLPNLKIKNKISKIKEDQYLNPITMYGINKLYCEQLGIYYSSHYQQLADSPKLNIDFRSVRFPGLISAETIPTGGTSDYAPEMIHFAAQGRSYLCFVRSDSTIPFMAMPDAIKALLLLTKAPKNKLSQPVYNVSGFSVSAAEIKKIVLKHFPKAKITYKVNLPRQKIVDSWPEEIDDSKAKKDWGWKADYNFQKAFNKYLIPSIRNRYKS